EVFADLNMLSTVFRNLVLNAIKFSYLQNTIVLTAKLVDEKAEVQITDHGVGIKEKDLERLFKIEESFSTPGTKREKGSGLGLILCKEFIEKNGGTIKVESEPGKGSAFLFTIPLS
ncbi:MAG TPA: ATP-binding protein, partial [Bacteroidales bacterium]|nr:ATP-binding protein [Bacteroidales bacterium]